MSWDLVLEILGFCIGVIYLWYEYHANSKVWIASVVMPCISMWIYFRKGLYADFGINIYYVAIAVYGYIHWTFQQKKVGSKEVTPKGSYSEDKVGEKAQTDDLIQKEGSLPITRIQASTLWGCIAVASLLWGALYLGLRYLTDSTVPIPDAFTTALSIVGLWMMARKYAEQWLVWLIVDAVCVALYIYKGIYFYAALYAIYTIVAAFGYRKWLTLAR